jgi:hypothetical protein
LCAFFFFDTEPDFGQAKIRFVWVEAVTAKRTYNRFYVHLYASDYVKKVQIIFIENKFYGLFFFDEKTATARASKRVQRIFADLAPVFVNGVSENLRDQLHLRRIVRDYANGCELELTEQQRF